MAPDIFQKSPPVPIPSRSASEVCNSAFVLQRVTPCGLQQRVTLAVRFDVVRDPLVSGNHLREETGMPPEFLDSKVFGLESLDVNFRRAGVLNDVQVGDNQVSSPSSSSIQSVSDVW